jgi:hypothetical protein
MLYPLATDPTTVLINFLKTHPVLQPLIGDRVSTYKLDTALTRIQLTLVPAQVDQPGFETYEYQVDCWGPTDAVDDIDKAQNLARAVCAAIYDLRHTSGVTVAVPTVRPFSLPDPDTGRPRFITQISFTISPEVAP